MPFVPATGITRRLKKKNVDQPFLSLATRAQLWEYFSEDVTRLSELLGRDLLGLWGPNARQREVKK
jgi:hypothetical protein